MAIDARGLTLERLQDRLARLGVSVSVSTLSKWQRGVSRPQRTHTLLAVQYLEQTLGLPAKSLLRLLDGPSGHEPRAQSSPIGAVNTVSTLNTVSRLRAELGTPTPPALTVLSTQEDLTVGATTETWTLSVRHVIRALRSGLDRCVVIVDWREAPLPRFASGRTCTLGQIRTDPAAGLVAAELLFGPLVRGETYPLEYRVEGITAETHYDRRFSSAGQHYDLTIWFPDGTTVRTVRRIWRLDAGSPHKDLAELHLIGGCIVHLADYDLSVGYHGIRWEYDAGAE